MMAKTLQDVTADNEVLVGIVKRLQDEVARLKDVILSAYEGDPDDLYSEGAKLYLEKENS